MESIPGTDQPLDPRHIPLFDIGRCPNDVLQAVFSVLPTKELVACEKVGKRAYAVAAKVWKQDVRRFGPAPIWCLPKIWCLSKGKISPFSLEGLTATINTKFCAAQGGYLYMKEPDSGTLWRLWKSVDADRHLQVVVQSNVEAYGYKLGETDKLFECYCKDLSPTGIGRKRSRKMALNGQGAGRCQLLQLLQRGEIVSQPFVPTYSSIAYREVEGYFKDAECQLPGEVKTRNPLLWIGIGLAAALLAGRLASRYAPDWSKRIEGVIARVLGVDINNVN